MSDSDLPDDELKSLDKFAHACMIYLLIVGLASFFSGAFVLGITDISPLVAPALIGFSGSSIAALTSCLDRYAVGFERENGTPFPVEAKSGEGKFTRRFAYWLLARPFLGAVVAPVFIWGLSFFATDPKVFLAPGESLGFTAFMSGLLAKSALDLVKNLFKNVFKA